MQHRAKLAYKKQKRPNKKYKNKVKTLSNTNFTIIL